MPFDRHTGERATAPVLRLPPIRACRISWRHTLIDSPSPSARPSARSWHHLASLCVPVAVAAAYMTCSLSTARAALARARRDLSYRRDHTIALTAPAVAAQATGVRLDSILDFTRDQRVRVVARYTARPSSAYQRARDCGFRQPRTVRLDQADDVTFRRFDPARHTPG